MYVFGSPIRTAEALLRIRNVNELLKCGLSVFCVVLWKKFWICEIHFSNIDDLLMLLVTGMTFEEVIFI
ncbi:hypothetical protein HanHA300_Chr03g0097551 [Helianthus annuus]|nr:hypothetical protein HanHA300_Chr03g0097551 [Helianthus annuus]KAJ0608503.1 hypothetical protein HanHA89_Chr03g0109251 [Helianthus annuus]KAJ0768567.1 hypothetical protein HanLR1_Chr03g0102621 [Helianthus annuus]